MKYLIFSIEFHKHYICADQDGDLGVGFGSLWKFYFFKIHKVNITENRPRIPSPLPSKHRYPSEPPPPFEKKILDPRMIQHFVPLYCLWRRQVFLTSFSFFFLGGGLFISQENSIQKHNLYLVVGTGKNREANFMI